MPAELLTERRDRTLLLTLSDSATRNALSPQVFAAGIETLQVAGDNSEIHCVVLRGDGAHFCAGGRLPPHAGQPFEGFVEALRACPKPVIAAVEGACEGAGFALAMACDLVVSADDARFAAAVEASAVLAGLLPRAVALEMLWLGEPVGAPRLQQWGLVQQVTAPGRAAIEALRLAERLSEVDPDAVAAVKERVSRSR